MCGHNLVALGLGCLQHFYFVWRRYVIPEFCGLAPMLPLCAQNILNFHFSLPVWLPWASPESRPWGNATGQCSALRSKLMNLLCLHLIAVFLLVGRFGKSLCFAIPTFSPADDSDRNGVEG